MVKPPLTVLIIGCGNIAGRFDEQNSAQLPTTHAGAYKQHSGFKLVACIEPDDLRREAFQNYWGVDFGFADFEQFVSADLQVDVVSICSPTSEHFSDINQLLSLTWQPRLFFCEKPIAPSLEQAQFLVKACQDRGVALAVNHNRRWDPVLNQLKADITANRYGKLRNVVALYNKGILNNGSHMLDLLQMLLGPLNLHSVIPVQEPTADPTVDGLLLTSDSLPIHLVTTQAQDYAHFELQFYFANAQLTMHDGGLRWSQREVVQSEHFSGYRQLSTAQSKPAGYMHTTGNAVENIYQALHGNADLLSSGVSALEAHRLCHSIAQASIVG